MDETDEIYEKQMSEIMRLTKINREEAEYLLYRIKKIGVYEDISKSGYYVDNRYVKNKKKDVLYGMPYGAYKRNWIPDTDILYAYIEDDEPYLFLLVDFNKKRKSIIGLKKTFKFKSISMDYDIIIIKLENSEDIVLEVNMTKNKIICTKKEFLDYYYFDNVEQPSKR